MDTLDLKIVTAINQTLTPGQAMNTAAHLGVGLAMRVAAASADGSAALRPVDYADGSGGSHPFISALPLIVLRGKSSELRRLLQKAREAGLACVDFTSTMVGGTYLDQIERSRLTPELDLTYFGVSIYGTREQLDPLTKRFSLWT